MGFSDSGHPDLPLPFECGAYASTTASVISLLRDLYCVLNVLLFQREKKNAVMTVYIHVCAFLLLLP